MRILLALIIGILVYFVAHLVFNQPISALLGVLAGILVFFGEDRFNRL